MTNNNQSKISRRTALKSFASIAAGTTLFTGAVGATNQRQQQTEIVELGERVPLGQAKKVAAVAREEYARRTYASWQKASLGKPKKYYTKIKLNTRTKYAPTAYVFPVETPSETVGYLTISARKKWSPVLEASTATPPATSKQAVKELARQQGEQLTGKFLYRGATTYSVELESGNQLYLNNGLKEGVTTETPQLEVEKHSDIVNTQWSTATKVQTDDIRVQSSAGLISGVEPWDANGGTGTYAGSDDGNANTSTPGLYGDTADPWDTWDGCSPFAGAQIIMYHEGISVSDIEEREEIADRLHILMGTDSEGWTDYLMPRVGITDYPASETQHDYTGYEEVLVSKGLFRSEVNADRPFIVNIPGGDKKVKAQGPYSGHSIIVYGYYETSSQFDVIHYNSWDTSEHRMQYGNWPRNTWVTRVVP